VPSLSDPTRWSSRNFTGHTSGSKISSEPTLPPHETFYSSLKKEDISQEGYALCQTVWKDKNWTSMRNHLEYYNNLDVEPLLQDEEKAFNVNMDYGLDAFKSSLTRFGLTLQFMKN